MAHILQDIGFVHLPVHSWQFLLKVALKLAQLAQTDLTKPVAVIEFRYQGRGGADG